MNWYTQIQINQMSKEAQQSTEWARILSTYGIRAILTLATLWGVSPITIQDAFAKQPQMVVKELEKTKQINNVKRVDTKSQPTKAQPTKAQPTKAQPTKADPQKTDSLNNTVKNENKTPQLQSQSTVSVEECMKFTEPHEGRRNKAYPDPIYGWEVPTIGVGFNLNRGDAPKKIKEVGGNYQNVRAGKESLSNQQINQLFKSDMKKSLDAALEILPSLSSQPKQIQMIFADLAFNLGRGGFQNYVSYHKIDKYLSSKEYQKIADRMKGSKWYKQVQPSRSHVSVKMIEDLSKK